MNPEKKKILKIIMWVLLVAVVSLFSGIQLGRHIHMACLSQANEVTSGISDETSTGENRSGFKTAGADFNYNRYLKEGERLGFEPSVALCRNILHRINRDFVDEVEPVRLFESVREELKDLLRESGLSSDPVKDLPLNEDIFQGALEACKGKASQNLVLYACIRGLIRGLGDQHSDFFTPEEYQDFLRRTREEEYSGIGIRITKAKNEDPVVVVEVFDEGPAKKAGIEKGDEIYEIDGKNLEGISLKIAAQLLTGKENTTVKISAKRNGENKAFNVKRKKILIRAVHHRMLEDKIGYIKIDSFKEEVNTEFRKAYTELEDKGIKGLILDMRNNPGGLVLSARETCGCFLPRDSMVSLFKHRGKENRKVRTIGRKIVYVPTVALINKHSASSAEIASACLRDHKAAVLLGETTRGKGSVQRTVRLSGGCALKLTIEKIFSPNGTGINEAGVNPDIREPMDLKFVGTKNDTQIKKAVEFLKGEIGKH